LTHQQRRTNINSLGIFSLRSLVLEFKDSRLEIYIYRYNRSIYLGG
jgi:hypothetical protein